MKDKQPKKSKTSEKDHPPSKVYRKAKDMVLKPHIVKAEQIKSTKKSGSVVVVNNTSFLKIQDVYTFGPNHLYPLKQFRLFDPFGIAVRITCSPDLIKNGQTYDVVGQVYNPFDGYISFNTKQEQWLRYMITNKKAHDETITSESTPHFIAQFKWTGFIVWWQWDSYHKFMKFVGRHETPGVFGVRAWIRAEHSYLYDIKGNLEVNNYVLRD